MEKQISCTFTKCCNCMDGSCKSIEDYRGCEFAITKNRLTERLKEEQEKERLEEIMPFIEQIKYASNEELYGIISSLWNNDNEYLEKKIDEFDKQHGTNTLVLTSSLCELLLTIN